MLVGDSASVWSLWMQSRPTLLGAEMAVVEKGDLLEVGFGDGGAIREIAGREAENNKPVRLYSYRDYQQNGGTIRVPAQLNERWRNWAKGRCDVAVQRRQCPNKGDWSVIEHYAGVRVEPGRMTGLTAGGINVGSAAVPMMDVPIVFRDMTTLNWVKPAHFERSGHFPLSVAVCEDSECVSCCDAIAGCGRTYSLWSDGKLLASDDGGQNFGVEISLPDLFEMPVVETACELDWTPGVYCAWGCLYLWGESGLWMTDDTSDPDNVDWVFSHDLTRQVLGVGHAGRVMYSLVETVATGVKSFQYSANYGGAWHGGGLDDGDWVAMGSGGEVVVVVDGDGDYTVSVDRGITFGDAVGTLPDAFTGDIEVVIPDPDQSCCYLMRFMGRCGVYQSYNNGEWEKIGEMGGVRGGVISNLHGWHMVVWAIDEHCGYCVWRWAGTCWRTLICESGGADAVTVVVPITNCDPYFSGTMLLTPDGICDGFEVGDIVTVVFGDGTQINATVSGLVSFFLVVDFGVNYPTNGCASFGGVVSVICPRPLKGVRVANCRNNLDKTIVVSDGA